MLQVIRRSTKFEFELHRSCIWHLPFADEQSCPELPKFVNSASHSDRIISPASGSIPTQCCIGLGASGFPLMVMIDNHLGQHNANEPSERGASGKFYVCTIKSSAWA